MPKTLEVEHRVLIAAPAEAVRAQYGDIEHHIRTGVHPRLRYRVLPPAGGRQRFEQTVRLLGLTQRDVFEREWLPDGSLRDTSVEGFNRGGSLHFGFAPARVDGAAGTEVTVRVRLPLPGPLAWLAPLLRAQVRRELAAAAREDKADIEGRQALAAGRAGVDASAVHQPAPSGHA